MRRIICTVLMASTLMAVQTSGILTVVRESGLEASSVTTVWPCGMANAMIHPSAPAANFDLAASMYWELPVTQALTRR